MFVRSFGSKIKANKLCIARTGLLASELHLGVKKREKTGSSSSVECFFI